MGLLGDKMLKAGVVSKADADRVHRQEVIEREKQRKMELFSYYQHVWLKKSPSSKTLKAMCTGFEHRGGMPEESDRPMCPGCARKKKGDYS
jgi:hypothetical protein